MYYDANDLIIALGLPVSPQSFAYLRKIRPGKGIYYTYLPKVIKTLDRAVFCV